jgi:hypothetical protein
MLYSSSGTEKGLTPVVVACNMKLSFLLSFLYISMLQAPYLRDVAIFPALIISKLNPVSCFMLILASQDIGLSVN